MRITLPILRLSQAIRSAHDFGARTAHQRNENPRSVRALAVPHPLPARQPVGTRWPPPRPGLEAEHYLKRASVEELDAGGFDGACPALVGEPVRLGGCLFCFPQRQCHGSPCGTIHEERAARTPRKVRDEPADLLLHMGFPSVDRFWRTRPC